MISDTEREPAEQSKAMFERAFGKSTPEQIAEADRFDALSEDEQWAERERRYKALGLPVIPLLSAS